MNTLADWLGYIITTLQTWSHCQDVCVIETRQFSIEQFAIKVRASLNVGGVLQVRLYCNREHIDYAYHVIYDKYAMRWDNKEHFPDLASFPHHFHDAEGYVDVSPLTGSPKQDLPLVLELLSQFWTSTSGG